MIVNYSSVILKPNINRVILRPFEPFNKERIKKIINRIYDLSELEVEQEFERVKKLYSYRHKDIEKFFIRRYNEVKKYGPQNTNISEIKKLLIGSYFSNEYSLESAALFNPSMVWHPDQSGLPSNKKRFIISLRATGEGHVSSIVFRSGVIDSDNNIELDPPSDFAEMPEINLISDDIYEARFEPIDISERTLFPQLDLEMNGMEDARFVLFTEDNGEKIYYATYCAYDGHNISMQLLKTQDFLNFTIASLKGSEVKNKGMALFPRKINGKYVMLSRQDNENNFIMFSDNLYEWNSKQLLMEPKYSWEFFQIGNCGSPIETDKGWLCLSHGVGPARRYSMGAFLLDKDDPAKLIGRLKTPLLEAKEHERNGYVPNVVYSCGGVINENYLVFPYAMSDYASSFAFVDLNELLDKLLNEK
ncbi:MAG: glycoside hydrolase family 130 protein [Melioribacteraceae bacterium]